MADVVGAGSNAAQAAAGGGAAGGASAAGGGNAQLQQSFQQAISEASQTLAISVTGQAQLNALRARPN
jgi:hypothetical protein